MTSPTTPVPSAAAEHLIACALRADDRPLYVAAIGCVTNVASAILMAPEIVRRIVVLWTAGYPTWTTRSNTDSFNLVQDVPAAQVLFDCGVPMIYLPGFHIGAQLRISLPEMEQWVRGYGAMGDYLYWLYTHNPIQRMMDIHDHFGRTWVIWDLINIAWLLNPDWAPSEVAPAAHLRNDTTWEAGVRGAASCVKHTASIATPSSATFSSSCTRRQAAHDGATRQALSIDHGDRRSRMAGRAQAARS